MKKLIVLSHLLDTSGTTTATINEGGSTVVDSGT